MIVTREWNGGDLFRERESDVKDEAEIFTQAISTKGGAVGKEWEGLIILHVC